MCIPKYPTAMRNKEVIALLVKGLTEGLIKESLNVLELDESLFSSDPDIQGNRTGAASLKKFPLK